MFGPPTFFSIEFRSKEYFESLLDGSFRTQEGQMIELGRKENGELKHHPGQELILSAPKSVSLWH